jgi:excisionase family DNA binding protein
MTPTPTAAETCADGAFSPDTAAVFTSLSRDEIDRAISRGELETFRHLRRVLIPKTVVVEWLAKKLEAARAERAK